MNALFIYLLQMMAASGLLYGYYHIALRNNKFHQYNRFYLLAITVISIIIPFLDIPYYFTAEEKNSSFVLQTLTVIAPVGTDDLVSSGYEPAASSGSISTAALLLYIYCFIAAIVLLRIVFSLLRIRRIIRNNPAEQLGNIHFINTNEPGTPFSFFRWLFWNRQIELQSEKGEQVFRHELFHIEQKHSYDIVFAELLTVIGWFNPFFHLIKKELKAIHEFLADQFAITENKKWQYAEMLLMQALHTQQSLVNPFFHSHIKRRIAMITLSKKPGHRYARKLLVIPVAALAVILFAFSYKEKKSSRIISGSNYEISARPDTAINPTKAEIWGAKPDQRAELYAGYLWVSDEKSNRKVDFEKKQVVINGETKPIQSIYNKLIQADSIFIYKPDNKKAIALYGEKARDGIIIFKNASLSDAFQRADTTRPEKDADKIFDRVEIEPAFPGGYEAWRNYLVKNMDETVADKQNAPRGTYTTIIMFIVDKNGAISNLKPLTHHGFGMEEEAMRVIRLSPSWIPASQNGHVVKAYRRLPITFVSKSKEKNASTNNPASNDNMIFSKVEIDPAFPGGEAKFREYTAYYQKNNQEKLSRSAFTEAVVVDFLVKTDGTITDVKAAPGTASSVYTDAAIDLIQHGPKWVAAVQNGRQVNAMKRQVVVFSSIAGKVPTTAQWVKASGARVPKLSLSEFKQATVYQLLQLENGTEITGYQLVIDKNEGGVKQIFNKGVYFNSASKELIKKSTAGNFVQFDQLTIRVDGVDKKMPAIVYELVN